MHRQTLEERLNDLRYRLATVYDFQGDRGMVDFLVGSLNGHPEEEEEKDDTVIPEILKEIKTTSVALLPAVWPFTNRPQWP